jgi:dihydrofolate reductase
MSDITYDVTMTTHFYTASSLDGFIATKHDSLEWLFTLRFDQSGPMSYESFIQGIGALVMSRSTYQWLLQHQDGWKYSQPTWIFTHQQLQKAEGADIRYVSDAVDESFAEIQASAQGKDIWVMGGGDLAGQFAFEDRHQSVRNGLFSEACRCHACG